MVLRLEVFPGIGGIMAVHRVKTQCGRMDHGGCTLNVVVHDGRIVDITPEADGPLSRGHMCPKGRALMELHQHPKRLRKPLKRDGRRGSGRWREVSWDEALKITADGFNRIKEKHGARSVAFCQGAPKGLEHFVLIRLANTFGSPNVVGPQNVCHMPREIPAMLTCGFYPVVDYDNPAEALLVWGSNLTATNEEGVICSRLLHRLKQDKPKLIVIDPRRTDLAERADLWLPVRPGTDPALALGFLQVIIRENLYDQSFVQSFTHGFDDLAAYAKAFTPDRCAEITGLSADRIVEAAGIYGRSRPAAIQWGNGFEQNTANFNTSRAVLSLMAICGNLDAPGGNIAATPPKVMRLGEFVRGDLLPHRAKDMISASHGHAPGFVIVAPEHFKRAVLDSDPYPVRGAYVHVSNPVLAWSDSRTTHQALASLDFLAVSETFMSPSAALADVVLPAATQLEFNDLGHFGLAHGFILARPKVVDPPPDCRSNPWILNELAKAMGLGHLWWEKADDMPADILAPAGITYEELSEKGILRGPTKFYKYKEKGFKTPTGKVELVLSRAADTGLDPLPKWHGPPEAPLNEFPLLLTGHKSRYFFCSDHRYLESLREREPDPQLEIHPDTAARYGIKHGDPVQVTTPYGRIRVKARVTDGLRPDVISLVHGWWHPELGPENPDSWEHVTYNMLTSSNRLNGPLGTPNLRGIPVKVSVI
jgi:anaerobic selenocysteine-containing dehydrogenase